MTPEERKRRKLLKEAIQAVKEKRHKFASYPSCVARGFTDSWATNGAKHYAELGEVMVLLESLLEGRGQLSLFSETARAGGANG